MSDRTLIAVLLVVLLLLPACDGDGGVSKKTYDQVKEGMTLEQVEAVLGKGTRQAAGPEYDGVLGDVTAYRWEQNGKSITATFVDGKVDSITRLGF